MPAALSTLRATPRLRLALALAATGGGGALVLRALARAMRAARAEQRALAEAALTPDQKEEAAAQRSAKGMRGRGGGGGGGGGERGGGRAGDSGSDGSTGRGEHGGGRSSRGGRGVVDTRFAARLAAILRICVPGIVSREAALIAMQGALLLCRTLLSDTIARIEGMCGEKVTGQDWDGFRRVVIYFSVIAIPAGIVNAALKATQILIQLAFRKRLTAYLHKAYLENRAYYSASVLGGLSHADQRLTDDVEKFCESIAELYSNTFKPLLDILLFTRSLAEIMGIRGQLFLHSYFIVIGALLRAMSPPLSLMTSQYSALNAAFRSAHARIAASAEEIAFNDPPAGRAEMQALNQRLERMVRHSRLTAFQRFVQSCVDGYLTKYTASVIGLVIFALPLYNSTETKTMSSTVIAGKYINAMRLMMQSASAMGQLVLVQKRLNTLAGHTARVSELLEEVKALAMPNGRLSIFQRAQARVRQSAGAVPASSQSTPLPRCDSRNSLSLQPPVHLRANGDRSSGSFADISDVQSAKPARMLNGPLIKLENVSVWSPDGSLLVRDLSLQVPQGSSVIIEGPNGCGKSSVLRMLAGLWPLQSGTVTLPPRNSMFFLSQRPYMFAGGSLAEQLMYPNLPGVVVGENVVLDEERAAKSLADVQLDHLVVRAKGFGGTLSWDDVLSGGERNRLAVARLLYHRPAYAILDEVRRNSLVFTLERYLI
jgi:ABC-type uncharacterized transport system fused permease/ATPase subunit